MPVPAIDLDATLADGAVTGSADLREPAMPVALTFGVTKTGVVDLDAKTASVDLARVRRIPMKDVHGSARARLRVHIEKQSLRANGDADVTSFAQGGTTLARAHAVLDVAGPLGDLESPRRHGARRGPDTGVFRGVADRSPRSSTRAA